MSEPSQSTNEWVLMNVLAQNDLLMFKYCILISAYKNSGIDY